MANAACYQGAVQSYGLQKQRVQLNSISKAMRTRRLGSAGRQKKGAIRCNIELQDFIGGDLIKLDLGQWLSDVEEHKAIAIYSPHEGGYEGRYLTRLKYQGYHFLDLSACGLGDPETTLTKFHPVCPVSNNNSHTICIFSNTNLQCPVDSHLQLYCCRLMLESNQ